MRSYDNIRAIATGQGDDYATGCLVDYNYFNNWYKMIAVELSKQQALDDLCLEIKGSWFESGC